MPTYMGPAYSSFKMVQAQEYQTEAWLKAVTQDSFDLTPSLEWSSDAWYLPDALAPFTQQNGKSTIQARPLVLLSAEISQLSTY